MEHCWVSSLSAFCVHFSNVIFCVAYIFLVEITFYVFFLFHYLANDSGVIVEY